jgi:hypothetical protein
MFNSNPAWMNKNIEKAKKAAEKITEPAQLMEIALSDVNEEVAAVAIAKVSDKVSLITIADSAKNMKNRLCAAGKITDEKDLADIAIKNGGNLVSEAVVDRISDQQLLSSIVKNVTNEVVARKAIIKVNVKELLVPFTSDKRYEIHTTAAKKLKALEKLEAEQYVRDMVEKIQGIKDQGELAQIALDAFENNIGDVSIAAVEKITDSSLIAGIALKAAEYTLRFCKGSREAQMIMLKKLQDEKVFAEILKMAYFEDVLYYAESKISDNVLLADVAKNGRYRESRLAAIGKLDYKTEVSQSVLKDIALTDDDAKVRCNAIRKITDEAFLNTMLTTEKDSDVIWNIKDQLECLKRGHSPWINL